MTELKKSTSSAEASPAKTCHAPALEKALKIAMGKLLAADCGESTQDSLANLGQDGSWQKMSEGCCQPLLISDQEETSELFCGTWSTWGLMRNGRVTALKPLARPTKEKECSSWPTPRVGDVSGGDRTKWAAQGKWQTGLREAVNLQNWPTPRAREGNSGEYGCKSCERNAGKFYLDGVVKQEEKIKGQLNADWVEILMGLPIGWTDIDKSNEELDEWPGWPAPLGANTPTPTTCGNYNRKGLSKTSGDGLNTAIVNSQTGQYPYEPPRVVEGQKNRAKRLKCLGNGCCPAQIAHIFKLIMEAEK